MHLHTPFTYIKKYSHHFIIMTTQTKVWLLYKANKIYQYLVFNKIFADTKNDLPGITTLFPAWKVEFKCPLLRISPWKFSKPEHSYSIVSLILSEDASFCEGTRLLFSTMFLFLLPKTDLCCSLSLDSLGFDGVYVPVWLVKGIGCRWLFRLFSSVADFKSTETLTCWNYIQNKR